MLRISILLIVACFCSSCFHSKNVSPSSEIFYKLPAIKGEGYRYKDIFGSYNNKEVIIYNTEPDALYNFSIVVYDDTTLCEAIVEIGNSVMYFYDWNMDEVWDARIIYPKSNIGALRPRSEDPTFYQLATEFGFKDVHPNEFWKIRSEQLGILEVAEKKYRLKEGVKMETDTFKEIKMEMVEINYGKTLKIQNGEPDRIFTLEEVENMLLPYDGDFDVVFENTFIVDFDSGHVNLHEAFRAHRFANYVIAFQMPTGGWSIWASEVAEEIE